MKNFLFSLAASVATLAPVVSCAASGTLSNITITSNKLERTFLLWKSSSCSTKPLSVILSYHGGGQYAKDQVELDGLTTADTNFASIIVYPQGINNYWQGVPGSTTDDVQFTDDILDYLENKYNIDKTRIYATGKSLGGGFCNVLACHASTSKRIAAFAPVSGAFYVDSMPCHPETVRLPCNPGRDKIPILEFHGGNDTVIHYDGGERKNECLPAVPHFIQQWAVRNGLGLQNKTRQLAKDTTVYTFGSGESAGLVRHIFESDIGHDWPSTAPNHDNSKEGHHVASYNATPVLLDFFSKYRLTE